MTAIKARCVGAAAIDCAARGRRSIPHRSGPIVSPSVKRARIFPYITMREFGIGPDELPRLVERGIDQGNDLGSICVQVMDISISPARSFFFRRRSIASRHATRWCDAEYCCTATVIQL